MATTTPYKVALVLDISFGEKLYELSERLHVWAVDSPINQAVAEKVWAKHHGQPYTNESGITTFLYSSNGTPAQWCADILDTLDLHHNIYSHQPEYTILEVYGLKPDERPIDIFSEFGFTSFQETDYGFLAIKGNKE